MKPLEKVIKFHILAMLQNLADVEGDFKGTYHICFQICSGSHFIILSKKFCIQISVNFIFFLT